MQNVQAVAKYIQLVKQYWHTAKLPEQVREIKQKLEIAHPAERDKLIKRLIKLDTVRIKTMRAAAKRCGPSSQKILPINIFPGMYKLLLQHAYAYCYIHIYIYSCNSLCNVIECFFSISTMYVALLPKTLFQTKPDMVKKYEDRKDRGIKQNVIQITNGLKRTTVVYYY